MMAGLITGSDGSLGEALCREHDRRHKRAYEACSPERHSRDDLLCIPRAIHTKNAIEAHLDVHLELVKRLDYAILNDGINHLSWIGQTPAADEAIMLRNVMAPYWTLNALVARRERKPMRVVFVTSQTYRVPQRTTSLYCASKAALTMLMKVAARELAPHGWIINAVAPGKIVDTEMSSRTDAQVMNLRGWRKEEMDNYARNLIPMQRFTIKTEIADTIFQTLALPSYVNGTVIEALGGV